MSLFSFCSILFKELFLFKIYMWVCSYLVNSGVVSATVSETLSSLPFFSWLFSTGLLLRSSLSFLWKYLRSLSLLLNWNERIFQKFMQNKRCLTKKEEKKDQEKFPFLVLCFTKYYHKLCHRLFSLSPNQSVISYGAFHIKVLTWRSF